MREGMILERLNTNNRILDVVNKRLDNIKTLFDGVPAEDFTPTMDGFVYSETVKAKTIFQTDDTTVTVGEWTKNGDLWPDHSHKDSVEYLIVIRGTFLLKIDEIPRIMKKGECASLPVGVKHSCTSLEDGSSIIGICIPPEKAYLVETLQCLTSQEKS